MNYLLLFPFSKAMNETEIDEKIKSLSRAKRVIVKEYLKLRRSDMHFTEPVRRIVARNLEYKLNRNNCSSFVYRVIREFYGR